MNSSKSKKKYRISYSDEFSPDEIKKMEKKRQLEKKIAKKEKKYKKKLEERLTKQLDEKIRKAKGKIAPISLSVPKGTPVIWSPNPGSQIRFLMCPFDEVLLEGNRGGGKTDVLLMDFIQHVNKGYGEAWRGILFRESYPQLADIIAKSKKWIPRMFPGSIFNKSEKTWTFPWGEQLLLRFMETPDDYNNYHGHEYPWCVDSNTLVKMGDGNTKKIKDINIGELVMTLEGPKPVLNITHRFKPSVLVSFFDDEGNIFGQQIQGQEHQLLSIFGMHNELTQGLNHEFLQFLEHQFSWLDYKSLVNGHLYNDLFSFFLQNQENLFVLNLQSAKVQDYDKSKKYLFRIFLQFLLFQYFCNSNKFSCSSSLKNGENFFSYINDHISLPKEFLDYNLRFLQLLLYYNLFSLELLKPFCQKILVSSLDYVDGYDQSITLILNSLLNHFFYYDHSDEQVLPVQENDQGIFPFFCENIIPIFYLHDKDDKGNIHAFDHHITYVHPYNKEHRQSTLNFSSELASCRFSPLDNRHLVDLTIADCSHYITELDDSQVVSSTHKRYVINKNCGWEELTNWATPECYNIMRSCNRSSHSKVPIKYRATCNPGGIGNQWVKARFVDIGPQMTVFTDEQGKKRCRITSRLDENKVLLKADPNYKNTLLSLTQDDPIKRKAWVRGSWNIIMGAALTDIWESKTHVIKPFYFPKTWKVYRSFDYGSQKPWAVTYGAVSNGENPDDRYYPKDTVFIIAELYGWNGQANQGDGATSIEIAEKVAEMDAFIEKKYKCRVYIGPADTSIWEVRDGKSIANSMNILGCRWTRAYKGAGSRVAGLSEIRQRLGAAKRGEVESPGLYFFDTVYHHIRTLTILPRDKNNNEDVDCFVAGTLVDTINGKVPIEKITLYDYVKTPIGYKKVIKAGIFRNAKVVSVKLSNGNMLRGTLDHKIFVENIGLVPLVKLKEGDTLCQSGLNISEELSSQVEKEVTLNVIQYIVNFLMEQHYCTEQYIKNIMERFQESLQYTTKIMTNLTIELKILNWFIREITQDTILKKDLEKVGIYTKNLENGEELKKVKKYFEIILKNAEKILPKENLRALIVINLLLQNKLNKYIVQNNVEKNQVQEKLKNNVLCAENYFIQKEIEKKKHKLVVMHVDGNYEEETVYNLTTEQAHLYYANDCLVSNTSAEDHAYDSLRYFLNRRMAEFKRGKVKV